MNVNKQPPFSNLKNAFEGKDNYKIGFLFLFGYLLTYFSKMQASNVPKAASFAMLLGIALVCSLFY
jgi:hypothetical protein